MANSIIFSNIERLIKEKGIKKMDFYREIGVSPEGFKWMKDNDTMKTQTLMKIAEVLEVLPGSLLEIYIDSSYVSEPEVKILDPNTVLYEVLKSLKKSVSVIEQYLNQQTNIK